MTSQSRIADLHEKLDYAERELADLRRQLAAERRAAGRKVEPAKPKPARRAPSAALSAIGIEPWMEIAHDSERK